MHGAWDSNGKITAINFVTNIAYSRLHKDEYETRHFFATFLHCWDITWIRFHWKANFRQAKGSTLCICNEKMCATWILKVYKFEGEFLNFQPHNFQRLRTTTLGNLIAILEKWNILMKHFCQIFFNHNNHGVNITWSILFHYKDWTENKKKIVWIGAVKRWKVPAFIFDQKPVKTED